MGGGGSRRPSGAGGGAGVANVGRDGRGRRRAAAAAPRSPPSTVASRATRIAAMWAGVVPQQPPTIAAPASSIRGTIAPKYSGPAA